MFPLLPHQFDCYWYYCRVVGRGTGKRLMNTILLQFLTHSPPLKLVLTFLMYPFTWWMYTHRSLYYLLIRHHQPEFQNQFKYSFLSVKLVKFNWLHPFSSFFHLRQSSVYDYIAQLPAQTIPLFCWIAFTTPRTKRNTFDV